MSRLFTDTDPKAEAVFVELLRKVPHRKLEMVGQVDQTEKTLIRIDFEVSHLNHSYKVTENNHE